MQPAFDGLQCQSEVFGNFWRGHAFNVAQDDDLSIAYWKMGNRHDDLMFEQVG
jgi:hypothetical protein